MLEEYIWFIKNNRLKNKKNKGTLVIINLRVLYSKGKYIIIPDPEDILSKNILNIYIKQHIL